MVPLLHLRGDATNHMASKNIARWERILRLLVGMAMIVLAVSGAVDGILRVGLLLFSWVPLATGALGWDPIYALLRIGSLRE